MDLSGLKWPIIIVVVVFVGWLFTSGGVNWMVGQATKAEVGVDAAKDARDEAMLSRIGGYLLLMWRYEKAAEVLTLSIERYPNGENVWYNYYRLVTCYERQDMNLRAHNILQDLIAQQAWNFDARVPGQDNLALRAAKLKEVHGLEQAVGY